jgi:hypothetical protein
MNECGMRCMQTSPKSPPVAKAIMVFSDAGSSSVGTRARIKLGNLIEERNVRVGQGSAAFEVGLQSGLTHDEM